MSEKTIEETNKNNTKIQNTENNNETRERNTHHRNDRQLQNLNRNSNNQSQRNRSMERNYDRNDIPTNQQSANGEGNIWDQERNDYKRNYHQRRPQHNPDTRPPYNSKKNATYFREYPPRKSIRNNNEDEQISNDIQRRNSNESTETLVENLVAISNNQFATDNNSTVIVPETQEDPFLLERPSH